MSLSVHQYPYRSDNYGFLIHDSASGDTACVDPGSKGAKAELAALEKTGWKLTQIWVTHHHPDHVAGLSALKAATGAHVVGPADSKSPIEGIDQYLQGGDPFEFANQQVKVLHTPGHTLDMLNYYIADASMVFTGDTLFAMGCGRLFEGDPAMMFDSMMTLKALPAQTQVYCSHEYTQANAVFSLTVDPDNPALRDRAARVDAMRAKGEATVPTSIEAELATNPYFRCDDPSIRAHLGLIGSNDVDVFTEIRKRKDNF